MSSPFADVSKVYPLENLSAHLRSFGIHPTAKRLLIARQMLSRHGHYCADEVYACLVQEKSAVSRATVYNTLKVFVEHGLLRELVVDASRTFYDSNLSPHPHLYNVDTGKFSDLKSDELPDKQQVFTSNLYNNREE